VGVGSPAEAVSTSSLRFVSSPTHRVAEPATRAALQHHRLRLPLIGLGANAGTRQEETFTQVYRCPDVASLPPLVESLLRARR
jgi:hypothetical protein